MSNKSIWIRDLNKNNYDNKLDSETDILIIGGGIAGLSCAYFLKDSNYKITLIDKSKISMGVTSKTTAKITYLQGIIYQTLAKNFGIITSKLYLESQKEAIELINNIVKDNNISCDLENAPSIIFTFDDKNISKIKDEKSLLKRFKIKTYKVNYKGIKSGIKVNDTYTFNPIKYLNGLVKTLENKVNIVENVTATKIKKYDNYYIVYTNKGNVKANKVIIASHYPFFIKPSFIPLKTYIKREYVCAVKVKNPKKFSAINIDKDLYSIRFYKDYLIYGSNNHKLTSKTDYKVNYNNSKTDFFKYFKKEPEYNWMNQDIVSNDSLPIIGSINKNLYILTAFNTWGMTNATIGGKIIRDLIVERESKYERIFNPKRINVSLLFNSFIGSFSYLKAYIKSIFIKNKPYYIKIDNIKYGVYKDQNDKMHYIKLICPHMKCSLVFNREEKTWDCPCHGSRFDLDGNVLEGPSTKKLQDKKHQ